MSVPTTNDQTSAAFDWIGAGLSDLSAAGRLRRRRTVRPLPGGRIKIDGRELWNFASNDYLDLAGDPRLAAAAAEAARDVGVGARASALVCGRTVWHEKLESRLAQFENAQACVLFPTGYAANVGAIGALVSRGDAVFCDKLNHASLIDGCRLSGARMRVFPHADLDTLEQLLNGAAGAGRRMIVTDGVFSMDGDVAKLHELAALAARYDAMLLVDEAHGTGVLGKHGRGAAEAAGIEEASLVRVGTLSKALGSQGGFVTGSRQLVDWIWNNARPQIFSTALSPMICAAAIVALDIVEREPDRRTVLAERAAELRHQLRDSGLNIIGETTCPIVPVLIGQPQATMAAATSLEESGWLVPGIRPPSVGTSRLRISLTCAHDADTVARLAAAVKRAVG